MGKEKTWIVNLKVGALDMICSTMSTISEFTHEFFEESSKAWKANKTKYGQASYKYIKNAFPKETNLPAPVQTRESKQRTKNELEKRQCLDEYAPPRVRRSPRLREGEITHIYCTSEMRER